MSPPAVGTNRREDRESGNSTERAWHEPDAVSSPEALGGTMKFENLHVLVEPDRFPFPDFL